MITTLLITFIIALIILVIFIEYKNERKYQEEKKKSNVEKNKHKTHIQPEHKIDLKATTKIPKTIQVKYPQFTHERLIKMGLSEVEVREFIAELIPQIEIQIPLIKDAINLSNFHQVERLTHHIKGSATNIGTGGVADLLVEYNTYIKSGTDIATIESYFQELIHYTNELKEQYT